MASNREIEQSAAEWLARRDAGPWHADEQRQLQAWLDAATAHRVAFLRLETAWQRSDRLKALGAGVPAGELPLRGRWSGMPTNERRTPAPRPLPHPRRRLPYLAAAAASLAVLVALPLGWRQYAKVEQADYATAVGELRTVPLADGSRITLSSDSRLRVSYSRGERHVALQQGEAYFAVAKDRSRPFVVGVDGHRVMAVGTRFDVRRDDASDLQVVVTQGLVRLEAPRQPGNPRPLATLLPAGSVASAGAAGVTVHAGTVQEAEARVDWREGFLRFHDTPLAVAVAEFNRYNTRQIVIGDPAVGTLRVGGNFRWSNAEAFVRLLTRAFPLAASAEGDTIVLRRRQASRQR